MAIILFILNLIILTVMTVVLVLVLDVLMLVKVLAVVLRFLRVERTVVIGILRAVVLLLNVPAPLGRRRRGRLGLVPRTTRSVDATCALVSLRSISWISFGLGISAFSLGLSAILNLSFGANANIGQGNILNFRLLNILNATAPVALDNRRRCASAVNRTAVVLWAVLSGSVVLARLVLLLLVLAVGRPGALHPLRHLVAPLRRLRLVVLTIILLGLILLGLILLRLIPVRLGLGLAFVRRRSGPSVPGAVLDVGNFALGVSYFNGFSRFNILDGARPAVIVLGRRSPAVGLPFVDLRSPALIISRRGPAVVLQGRG